MGTSRTAAQFGKKLDALQREFKDQKAAAGRVGMAGKGIFQTAGAGAVGRKPAGKRKVIGARFDIIKSNTGATIVVISYTGAAHLINNPTKAHFIGAKRLGNRTAHRRRSAGVGAVAAFGGSNRGAFGSLRNLKAGRGAQALTIGPNLRPFAFHPGTKGKDFYRRARSQAVDKLPAVYGKAALTEPLRKVFG